MKLYVLSQAQLPGSLKARKLWRIVCTRGSSVWPFVVLLAPVSPVLTIYVLSWLPG